MDYWPQTLVILSALSYLSGTFLLAYSIEFQADKLDPDDDSDLSKAVRRMGSPGKIMPARFRAGLVLNLVGFALLLISTLFQ